MDGVTRWLTFSQESLVHKRSQDVRNNSHFNKVQPEANLIQRSFPLETRCSCFVCSRLGSSPRVDQAIVKGAPQKVCVWRSYELSKTMHY